MIGNPEDAEQLYSIYHRGGAWRDIAECAGFVYVGSGTFRDVWRKGNVVYKVEAFGYEADTYDDSADYGNHAEVYNAEKLKGQPGIPEVTGHVVSDGNVVNAMPYFPFKISGEDEDARVIAKTVQVADVKPSNMRRGMDGKVWVVDLAAPARNEYDAWWWRE